MNVYDQFNPGNIRGTTGQEDYAAYFETRFPRTVRRSRDILTYRIKERICNQRSSQPTTIPPLIGGSDDIDINPDMRRFGDRPQNWWEENVRIGHFEMKADQINVVWESQCCYFFIATMFVEEITGDSRFSWFVERHVRMGEWSIEDEGCCD